MRKRKTFYLVLMSMLRLGRCEVSSFHGAADSVLIMRQRAAVETGLKSMKHVLTWGELSSSVYELSQWNLLQNGPERQDNAGDGSGYDWH